MTRHEKESFKGQHSYRDDTSQGPQVPVRRMGLLARGLGLMLVWVALAAIIDVVFPNTTYRAEYTASLVLVASPIALWVCLTKAKMDRLSAIVPSLILLLVVAVVILAGQRENPQPASSPESTSVRSPAAAVGGTSARSKAEPPSAPIVKAPKVYPPLRIASSGRIPTSLQGFALGMDFSDVVRLNPGLRNELGTGKARPSLNARNEALVRQTSAGGISVMIEFSAGRAIDITAELSSIDSGDADQIEATTFKELGAPTLEIDERGAPAAHPLRRWVWIDGDVRIAYQDQKDASGAHNVSAELIDYPFFIHGLEDPAFKSNKEQQLAIHQTQQSWGSAPKPRPRAPLPSEMEGLQLGETASQVNSTLPGAAIRELPDGTSKGRYRFANGNQLTFNLVHGNLADICEDRFDILPDHFDEFRKSLGEKFGPPNLLSGIVGMGTTGWSDGRVEFSYTTDRSQQGTRPVLVVCIGDRKLGWEWVATHSSPPFGGYKTGPADQSLFLPQDLRPQQSRRQ